VNKYWDVRPEVAEALATGRAVVALESTVIAHGLPRPRNLEAARAMEAAVRERGAVPATIGLIEGRVVVGLSSAELERLATAENVAKVSRRDFASVITSRGLGATTVAGTILAAKEAGIRMLATGGIGGVHRDANETLDVSNDLEELARTPIGVVCSGAKVILDLPKTLEMLETLGVPVVGYGTNEFPAFYSRESGLALQVGVNSAEDAARVMRAQFEMELGAAVVICNPPPAEMAIERAEVEAWITGAMEAASKDGAKGKGVTPYLLGAVAKASCGRTLETNIALLVSNARVAAEIAVALGRG